jgi:hypothetical protein
MFCRRGGYDLPSNIEELGVQSGGNQYVCKEVCVLIGIFDSASVLKVSQHELEL